jgi:hypothetical protein
MEPTAKQIDLAKKVANETGVTLPSAALKDMKLIGEWLTANYKPRTPTEAALGYAKKLAEQTGEELDEKSMLTATGISHWIDRVKAAHPEIAAKKTRDTNKPPSEKQAAIVVKHAPELVKTALENGIYEVVYSWIDGYFKAKDAAK